MCVLGIEVRVFPVGETAQIVAISVGNRAVGEARCPDDGDAVAGVTDKKPPVRAGWGGKVEKQEAGECIA